MSKLTLNCLPIHPAAELFPMMSEKEFQLMKEDIRLHGQNDDVLVWNGMLLDGRNRLRACTELGIEAGWSEIPKTTDPVAWVLSHNLHRRHLTTAQRAMVAEKLATLLHGDNQHKKEDSGIPLSSKTQENAAKTLHVSTDSVKKAREVRAKATKKVIAAVESGTMSLNAAIATTKQADAAKAAKENAKAEKANALKARAEAKALKAKDKADAAAAKEAERAAKAKAKADLLTTDGQISAIRDLLNQHKGKMMRLLDDLHRLKPNRSALDKSLKACTEVKLW